MSSNPLKVLAALSASAGVSVSGSSGLVVKQGGLNVELGGATITGNVSGSGTLQAGGDVTFGSNILKASDGATALTLSAASGDVAVAGDLKVGGNDIKASDNTVALTLSGADVNVAGDLKVGGNDIKASDSTVAITLSGADVNVAGDLKVGGNDIKASDSTVALTLSGADVTVAGDLKIGGNDIKASDGTVALTLSGADVTVAGNLTVRGVTTSIDSTTVNIGDANINLATGSATLASLAGAGVDLGSAAQVQWRYDNTNSAWTSNVGVNVTGALPIYKLAGVSTLTRVAGANAFVNGTNGSVTIGAAGTTSLSASSTSTITAPTVSLGPVGATQISVGNASAATASLNAGTLVSVGNVSTAVTSINGVASTMYGATVAAVAAPLTIISGSSAIQLSGSVSADGALAVAGNTLLTSVTASSNAKIQGELSGTAGYFSGLYVNGTPVGHGTATKTEVNNAYNQLRYVESGSLDGNGQKIVNLTSTTYGSTYFAVASLHSCSLDVLTDTDGSGWTNDLVAVKLFTEAGSLKVQIDAPASPNAGYRLVAINEKLFNIA
jgi:hypothetical protein